MKSIEIITILDRSGSMQGLHSDSVGQFNQYIKTQQEAGVKAKVTLVAFDDKVERIIDRVKLADVKPVKDSDFPPRGMTALCDAIGQTLAMAKDKPTVVLIMTDGHENRSTEYTSAQIKEMVEEKEKSGWEFQFFGAGIDAISTGSAIGIRNATSVSKSAAGMSDRSFSMNATTSAYYSKVNGTTPA